MSITAIANLSLFVTTLVLFYKVARKKEFTFSKQVFMGLVSGMLLGFYFKISLTENPLTMREILEWTDVIADSYIAFLRMLIMPLILVTTISAVVKIQDVKSIGKVGGTVIGVLISTTVIAAAIGITVALFFGLSAEGLPVSDAEIAHAKTLEVDQIRLSNFSTPELIVSLVPSNIFFDLTGARSTSIIGVVIFSILLGIAALLVSAENKEYEERIHGFFSTAQVIIMRLVKLIMAITPYGIIALMIRVTATADGEAFLNLINFVLASYVAIALMFVVHVAIVKAMGHNIKSYLTRIWPVLVFAFVSRSSAATIPLTIRTQIEDLKVPTPIAGMAASLGATIGQNGCAGIYPAILVIMVAASPTMSEVALDFNFFLSLLIIIAIGSFGIAGVGGGAINAAFLVLPAMGFPITVVALLISIEPLIDMARTALNVSGAITSGIVTARFVGDETWSQ